MKICIIEENQTGGIGSGGHYLDDLFLEGALYNQKLKLVKLLIGS